MDRQDETRPDILPGRKGRFLNRNVIVFAFFLILSFIFWYLNSLGKDLEAEIRYPVSFTNIPENRFMAGERPARVNLNIKGPGYSILRLKIWGNAAPLLIDLSKVSYRRVQGTKANNYYIVSSGLVPAFNSQLRTACRIASVRPDTLYFTMSQTSR